MSKTCLLYEWMKKKHEYQVVDWKWREKVSHYDHKQFRLQYSYLIIVISQRPQSFSVIIVIIKETESHIYQKNKIKCHQKVHISKRWRRDNTPRRGKSHNQNLPLRFHQFKLYECILCCLLHLFWECIAANQTLLQNRTFLSEAEKKEGIF